MGGNPKGQGVTAEQQALYDCMVEAGADTDGDTVEWYVAAQGQGHNNWTLADLAVKAVKQLAADYNEGIETGEIALSDTPKGQWQPSTGETYSCDREGNIFQGDDETPMLPAEIVEHLNASDTPDLSGGSE